MIISTIETIQRKKNEITPNHPLSPCRFRNHSQTNQLTVRGKQSASTIQKTIINDQSTIYKIFQNQILRISCFFVCCISFIICSYSPFFVLNLSVSSSAISFQPYIQRFAGKVKYPILTITYIRPCATTMKSPFIQLSWSVVKNHNAASITSTGHKT